MTTLLIIIASTIFSVLFAYRNYWQIEQFRTTRHALGYVYEELDTEIDYYNEKWHKWQFALQIYIGLIIWYVSFLSGISALNSFGHGLLFGSIFWLIFDTLLGYLLTGNLLHVDKNGIGMFYTKTFKTYDKTALAISKVLFVAISITLTLL
jgi:hypothetical protein